MTHKLDDFLDKDDIPAPSENARKAALNMASAAFDEHQKEKMQKKSQGFFSLRRLIGMNTSTDNRRSDMQNRNLFYGGMATAMVVILAGGAALYQTKTHEWVKGQDIQVIGSNGSNVGIKTTSITSKPHQENSTDGNESIIAETKIAQDDAVEKQEEAIATQQEVVQADMVKDHSFKDKHVQSAQKKQALTTSSRAAPEMLSAQNYYAGSDGMAAIPAPGIIAPYPPMPHPIDVIPPQRADNDKFEDHEISAVKQVSQEPVSTFSADVDTASYAFVRRQLQNGRLPNPDAVRIEEMINYFPYAYQGPKSAQTPFKANIAVTDAPWKPGNKLIHIGIKGYDLEKTDTERPRANLVFLLDVSGSMNQPDKLPLLKNSFRMLLNTLHPDDTVSIVTYAGRAGVVLEPTKVAEKEKIAAAMFTLGAGGSTAGAQGIKSAYDLAERNFDQDAVNRVILATDGDFNVGMSSNEALKELIEKKRDSGIFLSVLGFGQGNLNDHLMQTLAQNGNGIAAHIDSLSEAQKVLVDEATSSLFPIAKDVKLQVEFNPDMVSEYRLIGYETRSLKREDFNNDKVDAGDIGAGHTVTAIYEITPKGSGNELYGKSRYIKTEQAQAKTDFGGEYAFLKMRYKLPSENTSKLITTPITQDNIVQFGSFTCGPEEDCIQSTSPDQLFSIAVAGFGQLLKNDKYLSGNFTYDSVLKLAQESKGDDPYGYRAEFINLVRLTQSLNGK